MNIKITFLLICACLLMMGMSIHAQSKTTLKGQPDCVTIYNHVYSDYNPMEIYTFRGDSIVVNTQDATKPTYVYRDAELQQTVKQYLQTFYIDKSANRIIVNDPNNKVTMGPQPVFIVKAHDKGQEVLDDTLVILHDVTFHKRELSLHYAMDYLSRTYKADLEKLEKGQMKPVSSVCVNQKDAQGRKIGKWLEKDQFGVAILNYKEGKMHGPLRIYTNSGYMTKAREYENGELVGRATSFVDGCLYYYWRDIDMSANPYYFRDGKAYKGVDREGVMTAFSIRNYHLTDVFRSLIKEDFGHILFHEPFSQLAYFHGRYAVEAEKNCIVTDKPYRDCLVLRAKRNELAAALPIKVPCLDRYAVTKRLWLCDEYGYRLISDRDPDRPLINRINIHNRRHGVWVFDNGASQLELTYDNGQLDYGFKEMDADGNLFFTGHFREGIPTGYWYHFAYGGKIDMIFSDFTVLKNKCVSCKFYRYNEAGNLIEKNQLIWDIKKHPFDKLGYPYGESLRNAMTIKHK